MKTKVAIINSLKPVDDVRAFEKIALSIAKTNKYEVNIIGNEGKKEKINSKIIFYPITLSRSIPQRLIHGMRVLRRLLKIKPSIIIVTTHELLLIACMMKLLQGSRIVYDVQEDYRKNIRHLSSYPLPIRGVISSIVRLKEKFASMFIDQFWLAEKCYSYEISFPKHKSVVLENLANKRQIFKKDQSSHSLLFSGSISHYSEILLALDLFNKYTQKEKDARLVVIGQCHDQRLIKLLEKLSVDHSNITLNVTRQPIPHEDIIAEIFQASLGLISYQKNEVNKNKVPTKLFEYAHYQLPYCIQSATNWENESRKLGGGIPIDFHNPDIEFILEQVKNSDKLFTNNNPFDRSWESQEILLNSSIESLIKSN